jgi:DNA-binding IclR family transcriptional regulator
MKPLKTNELKGRRQRVQSAEIGISILKSLAKLGGAASLTSLAAEVGESTAKVHRYLSSFMSEGFVSQHADSLHYYLGPEAIKLGVAALRQCDPVRLGEASLIRLRQSLEVTCFIAVLGNQGPTVLRIEEPSLPVTVNIRAGSVLPYLWSATGQVFLSFSEDEHIRQAAQLEYDSGSKEQRSLIPKPSAMLSFYQKIKKQQCVIVNDTLLRGISAVSAPIFDASGHACAAITALGASSGFDTRLKGDICTRVIAEAADISTAMGFGA